MNVEFNFDALEREIEKLKQAANPEAVDGAVLGALRVGGALVQGMAKNLCRVDEGQLRNSIEVTDLREKVGVDVGTNVEHAVYNEYGTGKLGDPSVPHTSKDYWRYQDANGNWHTTHGMAAQPFLYPAVEGNKEPIAQLIKDALQSTIK